MLNYYLRKSHLTNLTDKYTAQVTDVRIHDMESIIALMGQEESLVNDDEVRLILNTFYKVMKTIVKNGEGVNTNIFKAMPSIQGVFDSADSHFVHGTQTVEMNLKLSKPLDDLLPTVKVHKTDTKANNPFIIEVYDVSTGSVNNEITLGKTLKIIGSRLKIIGGDSRVGFYFIKADGTEVKLTDNIIVNDPSLLVLPIPSGSLVVGDKVTVKIVTQYSGGKLLKTPHIGTYETVLTVV